MRLLVGLLWLAGAGTVIAADVPLPRPRPALWSEPQSFREAAGADFNSTGVTSAPTDCDQRLQTIAAIELMPRLIGPDTCGGSDMVRLDAVIRPNDSRIELRPAPLLHCAFAESVAAWLRDEVAPRVGQLGTDLRGIENYDDYECRHRNRIADARPSEHGNGNAIDLRSFILGDGRTIGLTDMTVAKEFRDGIRESACHRFTTVLGPGSDSHHEGHIHLDLMERRQGSRICQWEVREPATGESAGQIPLPLPRPAIADVHVRHTRKL